MAKVPRGGPFPTTRWSVVLTAADRGEAPRRALHELCAAYWAPLFAFLRRTGMSVDDAEDTVQGFVSSLLDGPAIAGVDRERGRFRSYLLGALRNYLNRQQARARAEKRGGGTAPVSLTTDGATAERELEIPDDRTPEGAYAYAWAMSILRRAEEDVARHYAAKGKSALFEALQPTLLAGEVPAYRDLAERLGLSEGAARVAAHRIRSRFGEALRAEVAQTVSSKAEIEAELRAVIDALRA
jgi:DNA-directed RNA polymerase specialized sigma24 family protein